MADLVRRALRQASEADQEATRTLKRAERERNALACPKCAGRDTRVVDVRGAAQNTIVRRRRQCHECGHRFTSYERSAAA